MGTGYGVAGVVDKIQTELIGQLLQPLGIARAAPEVDAKDCDGARRYQSACGHCRQVVGNRIDVAKDRLKAGPRQCLCSGGKREGRYDDLTFDCQCPSKDHETHRTIGYRDGMPNASVIGKGAIQLIDQRTVVCIPLPLEDAAKGLFNGNPLGQVELADMVWLPKLRLAAEDRQGPGPLHGLPALASAASMARPWPPINWSRSQMARMSSNETRLPAGSCMKRVDIASVTEAGCAIRPKFVQRWAAIRADCQAF